MARGVRTLSEVAGVMVGGAATLTHPGCGISAYASSPGAAASGPPSFRRFTL
jgi:hypothetical protein